MDAENQHNSKQPCSVLQCSVTTDKGEGSSQPSPTTLQISKSFVITFLAMTLACGLCIALLRRRYKGFGPQVQLSLPAPDHLIVVPPLRAGEAETRERRSAS